LHPAREAVVRCPRCGGNFCGECVVEHESLLLCASCLAKEKTAVAPPVRAAWTRLRRAGATVASAFLLWLAFYWAASVLRLIPSNVHDGTVWPREEQP